MDRIQQLEKELREVRRQNARLRNQNAALRRCNVQHTVVKTIVKRPILTERHKGWGNYAEDYFTGRYKTTTTEEIQSQPRKNKTSLEQSIGQLEELTEALIAGLKE